MDVAKRFALDMLLMFRHDYDRKDDDLDLLEKVLRTDWTGRDVARDLAEIVASLPGCTLMERLEEWEVDRTDSDEDDTDEEDDFLDNHPATALVVKALLKRKADALHDRMHQLAERAKRLEKWSSKRQKM